MQELADATKGPGRGQESFRFDEGSDEEPVSGDPATAGAHQQRATSPSNREAQDKELESGDLGNAATTVVAGLFRSLMVTPLLVLTGLRDALGLGPDQGDVQLKRKQELKDAKWYIVHPQWRAVRAWDICQTLIVFYMFTELPYRLAFRNTELESFLAAEQRNYNETANVEKPAVHSWVDDVLDTLLAIDLLLMLVQARYDFDPFGLRVLIVQPQKLLGKWVDTTLVRDCLAQLPIDTLARGLGHPQLASYLRVLRLLRMDRVWAIQTRVRLVTRAAIN